MKLHVLFLSSLLAFSAAPSSAATLVETCGRFNDASLINRCLRAARGLSVDPKALDVCNRFNSADPIIGCVETVAGREYEKDEIDICNRFNSADLIIECMGVAGRIVRGGKGERCSDVASMELRACRRAHNTAPAVLACLERAFGF